MFSLKRALELVFLGMVFLSAALLGFSQGNWQLAAIAVMGACLAWVLVDWLGWFRLPRWLANLLSLGALVLTMREFFLRDSSLQLIAVANLLVYLQTILLYQEKTSRQYWQLAVLNFLQVVVATIFSLEMEGGILFLGYMTLAGGLLLLITLETDFHPASPREFLARWAERRSAKLALEAGLPQTRFLPPPGLGRQLPELLAMFFSWTLISICFSALLFVLVPRRETAWFGPEYLNASATGISKTMELDPRGQLKIDTTLVFRAKFINPGSDQPVNLSSPAYMRGLALSQWSVENGITRWSAPYDRLDRFSYVTLPRAERSRAWYQVEFTLEPTTDPLLYSCQPAFIPRGGADETDFCLELSALSRKRDTQKIEQRPFKYELWVPRSRDGELARSWPYESGASARSARTLEGNPNERNGLLHMDPARYPQTVAIASGIAKKVGKTRTLELARALEEHFLKSTEYRYTTDFTRIPRQPGVDPVEDFVANHKLGHCEMYASALTLMLRSQGIPARIVVGYCGGSYNSWAEMYLFSNEYAHAWVEAYLPPEACTSEMLQNLEAGPGGAWMILDPTPPESRRPSEQQSSTQAIDLARTVWQEYVLGLDKDSQQVLSAQSEELTGLDLDLFSDSLQVGIERVQQSPGLRLLIIAGVLLLLTASFSWSFFRTRKTRRRQLRAARALRRLMGQALGVISPRFGQWLLSSNQGEPSVPFYLGLVDLLGKHGLRRRSDETHREFLNRAATQCRAAGASVPAASGETGQPTQLPIPDLLPQFERAFHAVRFGGNSLSRTELEALETNLQTVAAGLARLPRGALSGRTAAPS